jgi:hypothetical protein
VDGFSGDLEAGLAGVEEALDDDALQGIDLEAQRLGVEDVLRFGEDDVPGGDALPRLAADRHPVRGQRAARLRDHDVAPGHVEVALALVLHGVRGDVEGCLGLPVAVADDRSRRRQADREQKEPDPQALSLERTETLHEPPLRAHTCPSAKATLTKR